MVLKKYYKSISVFLLILVLCFLPGNTVNKIQFINIPHFDKLVHFGMYFVFSFVFFIDLKKNSSIQKKQIILIILFLSLIIGGSIELIQNYFIPMRSGDWFDLLADLGGSLIFVFISKYFIRFFKKLISAE